MTEYYKMPPMNLLEDYDKCLGEYPQYEAVYCIVNAEIKQNASNPLSAIIQVIIENCACTDPI